MFAVCCDSEVLRLRTPFHIIFFILNIVLPGLGTVLSAFPCSQERTNIRGQKQPAKNARCGTIVDGILQLVLTPIVIGWIWSIMYGYALFMKGRQHPMLEEFQ